MTDLVSELVFYSIVLEVTWTPLGNMRKFSTRRLVPALFRKNNMNDSIQQVNTWCCSRGPLLGRGSENWPAVRNCCGTTLVPFLCSENNGYKSKIRILFEDAIRTWDTVTTTSESRTPQWREQEAEPFGEGERHLYGRRTGKTILPGFSMLAIPTSFWVQQHICSDVIEVKNMRVPAFCTWNWITGNAVFRNIAIRTRDFLLLFKVSCWERRAPRWGPQCSIMRLKHGSHIEMTERADVLPQRLPLLSFEDMSRRLDVLVMGLFNT